MILEECSTPNEYELLDSGDGERLERFGEVVLIKPDPAVLWHRSEQEFLWQSASAIYQKKEEERGDWKLNALVPEKWLMHYGADDRIVSFYAKLTPFKHTGVFPEQAANWDFMTKQVVKNKRRLKVLNLFGYTGIASVLCAKLGCEVTHVDASRPSISWAKENMLASGLPEDSIRWILDDCLKFVKREVKRGQKYDAIIMDPPAFGRGAKGEVWKFNEDLPVLLEYVRQIVADEPAFVIINAYAVSVSSVLLKNMLEDFSEGLKNPETSYGELVLRQKNGRLLSTGIFGRLWSN